MAADVELERVSKLYGTFKAVDDVTLTIPKGSFISILGSSGAGKSTILRMIGGFEYPDYGTVRIGGQDVTMLPPHRRNVNTVFQNYALFPHMNAAENVAYGLRQDGVSPDERKSRVREALEMVEMLAYAMRKPNELSGGQQQRIALARALVKRPAVLLLDEPLGALDRKLRQQMQVELKLLQSQLGLTFVFVTHDQEEALAMSDSIAVMRHGRIEQLGGPTELYDAPATAFVASFIGAQNFIAGTRIDDTLRMTSEDGSLFEAGVAAPGVERNARVLGAVRPENVSLARDERQASANRVAATVAASVMLGDAMEYVLRLSDGNEFIARLPRRGAETHAPGARVFAHWEPSFFQLFPYEDLRETRRLGA
ncbi:ABC transporter ATP-binding protein [Aestuariivirga sp.]|uniref:ABC transporter ATP-binding protein n=1 Tax=Aestuariivirga sp. TaxID=2650926 RepID=UPI00391B668F